MSEKSGNLQDRATIVSGDYSAQGACVAIVVSRFNEPISKALLDGALQGFYGHHAKQVDVYWTPGAFEISAVANRLAASGRYDALLCLGVVIRGETPHFEYISGEVSRGVAQVAREASVPVIFGVLTTDTVEQAWARAGVKMGNKGFEGALAAIELASLYRKLPK